MDTRRLDAVADITMGQAPEGESYNLDAEGLPLIAGAGDFGELHPKPKKFTTAPGKTCQAGDVVLGIRATIGEKVLADGTYCLGRGVAGLRVKSGLDERYLWHWLTDAAPSLAAKAKGATFKQVNREDIGELRIALPPLPEQRRIAKILDKADALRAKRRVAIAKLDSLTQSIFLDMFGDPATNPKGWPSQRLGECASKFSDGPFGSNLKSSHYTQTGIRVVRLQNIGVNAFLNADAAYISEHHFAKLKKHECLPGDVLVGTLGEPNLRACIQPNWLSVALNKADCVQIRPDARMATSEFLCALLNQPSTARMAQDLMHGQTRVRISMGRLRNLSVPIPPIGLQRKFATRVSSVETLKGKQGTFLSKLNDLFSTVQHRAFRGDLKLPEETHGVGS